MSKVIKLGNYKGIEFKVEKVPVSNEEVEQQIQMILAQSSQTEEKDGDTVENGDIATIDFVGLKDDVAFEGGTGNDYDLEIGSGSFIPGFEEQMIGMKVNETRDLNLTFPENYQAEDLAGQDVVFKVTVKKLSVKKEAELNDDFVEGLGVPEIKTVEDLKAYINEGLQQQHDQQYEAQKENTIFDAFMADSEVELDDDAIDEALDRQMSYMANQMMAQGIQLDQYLQMTGMDEEKLREQMKPSATQQAKLEALIDEIIAVEKIVVTEEVLDEQLNMVGQANQMTKEQVLEKIDLEIASEFITMASKLLEIKSRYLLYKQKDNNEVEDPRLELMEKLEEYKKFKLASQDLKDNITYVDDLYYRKKEEIIIDDSMNIDDISIDAIKNILPYILKVKSEDNKPHKYEKLDKIVRGRIVPVEEKIAYIREIISRDNEVSFIKVIENVDKDEVIATFLSVLELIKSREIVVYQDLFFDDILIKKNLES